MGARKPSVTTRTISADATVFRCPDAYLLEEQPGHEGAEHEVHTQRPGEQAKGERDDEEDAEVDIPAPGQRDPSPQPWQNENPGGAGDGEERRYLGEHQGEGGGIGKVAGADQDGDDGQQEEAEHIVEDGRRDDDLAHLLVQQAEFGEHLDGDRHRGHREPDADDQRLRLLETGFGEEDPGEGEAAGQWQQHAARRHREGFPRVPGDLPRPHLDPGEQHEGEDAGLADEVDHRTVADGGKDGDGRRE